MVERLGKLFAIFLPHPVHILPLLGIPHSSAQIGGFVKQIGGIVHHLAPIFEGVPLIIFCKLKKIDAVVIFCPVYYIPDGTRVLGVCSQIVAQYRREIVVCLLGDIVGYLFDIQLAVLPLLFAQFEVGDLIPVDLIVYNLRQAVKKI